VISPPSIQEVNPELMLPKVMFIRCIRCLTSVRYNLCDTHLSSRGLLRGVTPAYVFFHATHLGSYWRVESVHC